MTAVFFFLSGQAAQRSGGRGPQPERQRREQPKAVRGAEGQDAATEEPNPAGENAEEDHRGETCVFIFEKQRWRKSNWCD